ncbi:zinc finger BED domain-containing protein RICESLEEPER 2-like protein [Tanacetum coccineum]
MYGNEEWNDDGNQVVSLCRNALKELLNDYKRIYSDQHLENAIPVEIEGNSAYFESDNFTVLGQWKKRSPTFPILSRIARDILAILDSTMAS